MWPPRDFGSLADRVRMLGPVPVPVLAAGRRRAGLLLSRRARWLGEWLPGGLAVS